MSNTKSDNTEHHKEDSFLRRWSARKARIAVEERSEPKKNIVAEIQDTPEKPGEQPSKQELTDADMPPLDTLDEHSDYSVFFSPKVSEELRRLALRKLFHSPAYNITDGLDDYAGDYTQFAKLGDVITQDMRHLAEVEARRALETAPRHPDKDETDKAKAIDSTKNRLTETETSTQEQIPTPSPKSDEEPTA